MFNSLIGNAATKDAIKRFVSSRRVPNSLLFSGPEGVGKKQFALELARTLVCRQSHDHEACGECVSCTRVNTFALPGADAEGKHYDAVFFSEHPDVGLIVPFNRTLRVGSIRALEAEANYLPYEAPARIFIIDDAHKMNDAASNALLKTLEEPPSTSHIFLVTAQPDALLPTIRSRVQTLRFGPVASAEIEQFLLRTHEYSQDDARLIASTSNGSFSRALRSEPEAFRELRSQAVEILRASIIDGDLAKALSHSEKIGSRSTSEFEEFLDILQGIVHMLWSALVASGYDGLPADLADLAANAQRERLASWLEFIEEIRATMNVNINKKSASDALFVRMAAGGI